MGDVDQTPQWLAGLSEDRGRALVLFARQWCDCPEDVVQEALVKLVGQANQPQHVVAWLYRVVRNGAISAARQQRRRARRELAVAASEAWFDAADGGLDVDEATAALADLPLEMREVVVARIWGELTFADIAELSNSSTSTAQRRYEQAIRELQKRLEKPCETNRRTKPS